MITTCSRCSKLYEAGSEEQAHEPDRLCATCARFPLPAETPRRIAQLPRCPQRHIPVPWFVAWIDGVPDFRVIGKSIADAWSRRLCWICGQSLGANVAFVIGPMCAINRVSAEPPSHRDCAIYAAKACPFLTRPKQKRRTNDLPEGAQQPAGEMICRNPGVTLVWSSRNPTPFSDGKGGVLFNVGEPIETLWLCEGRPATRAEVEAAIDSGLPILQEMAERDGAEATALLDRMLARAAETLPK